MFLYLFLPSAFVAAVVSALATVAFDLVFLNTILIWCVIVAALMLGGAAWLAAEGRLTADTLFRAPGKRPRKPSLRRL
jgi:hypothetical protein